MLYTYRKCSLGSYAERGAGKYAGRSGVDAQDGGKR